MDLAAIRKEYKQKTLLETDVAKDPITQFATWFAEATNSDIDEVTAMTIATCSNAAVPSARTVLLKGYSAKGFVFYTNYNSQKGIELQENPRASLLFFWPALERQIRITGIVQKLAPTESDAYFKSRPIGSQIGAIASPQSHVIANREWLQNEVDYLTTSVEENSITRPKNWGGFIVQPVAIEYWQGRPSRLHDRLLYTLQPNGEWSIDRLAP